MVEWYWQLNTDALAGTLFQFHSVDNQARRTNLGYIPRICKKACVYFGRNSLHEHATEGREANLSFANHLQAVNSRSYRPKEKVHGPRSWTTSGKGRNIFTSCDYNLTPHSPTFRRLSRYLYMLSVTTPGLKYFFYPQFSIFRHVSCTQYWLRHWASLRSGQDCCIIFLIPRVRNFAPDYRCYIYRRFLRSCLKNQKRHLERGHKLLFRSSSQSLDQHHLYSST